MKTQSNGTKIMELQFLNRIQHITTVSSMPFAIHKIWIVIQTYCNLLGQVGRMGVCQSRDPLGMSPSHFVNYFFFIFLFLSFFFFLFFSSFSCQNPRNLSFYLTENGYFKNRRSEGLQYSKHLHVLFNFTFASYWSIFLYFG